MKIAIGILATVCLVLAGGWWLTSEQVAAKQRRIGKLTEDREQLREDLKDIQATNQVLHVQLTNRHDRILALSNQVERLSGKLSKTEKTLGVTKQQLSKSRKRIAALESDRHNLSGKMETLKGEIGTLETQIAQTKEKLAVAKGDRKAVVGELKRLQAEKRELERQFNNLAVLRRQVSKIKEELAMTRRLEWIRKAIYGLVRTEGASTLGGEKAQDTNIVTDVEIRRQGGTTINRGAAETTP